MTKQQTALLPALVVFALGALATGCESSAQGCRVNADCGEGTCCLLAEGSDTGSCLASELVYPADGACGEACTVSSNCGEGLKCFSPDDDGCEDGTGMCADEAEQGESQLCD